MGQETKIEWTDQPGVPRPGGFRIHILALSGRRLGSFKRAAKLAELSLDDYITRLDAGLKRCLRCRRWRPDEEFGADLTRWDGRAAKCQNCANAANRDRYAPVPFDRVLTPGPARHAPRDGDKIQARHLINLEVVRGLRPDPDALHCALCGHKGDDRRHEYHHHRGYSAEHHYDVIVLCSTCHHEEHSDGENDDSLV